MQHSAEMRRCLEALDIEGARRLWAHMSPHLPQPRSDTEAAATLHHARTQSDAMPIASRAYSHRWLLDHGLPSGLPDHLKPKAERLYPRIVEAVGIAVMSQFRQVKEEVSGAMIDVVENCYADRKTDPDYVKPRMLEARNRVRRRLGLV